MKLSRDTCTNSGERGGRGSRRGRGERGGYTDRNGERPARGEGQYAGLGRGGGRGRDRSDAAPRSGGAATAGDAALNDSEQQGDWCALSLAFMSETQGIRHHSLDVEPCCNLYSHRHIL